eukprot:GHVS01041910.1.p1 GENE.GHVS01041910.1~~GHVS01041910.1.p1  ORF type:complete len:116 (+),score=9.22 GHVS01041910.1:655-1002(+)
MLKDMRFECLRCEPLLDNSNSRSPYRSFYLLDRLLALLHVPRIPVPPKGGVEFRLGVKEEMGTDGNHNGETAEHQQESCQAAFGRGGYDNDKGVNKNNSKFLNYVGLCLWAVVHR